MDTTINSEWLRAVLYHLSMMGIFFALGWALTQAGIRWRWSRHLPKYRRWRLEEGLFVPATLTNLILFALGSSALAALAFVGCLTIGALPTSGGQIGKDEAEGTATLAVFAFVTGAVIEWVRCNRIDLKRRRLDALKPVFSTIFPVSELLSMYECLQKAPQLFWDEYANLRDVEVNEMNNRRFRDRVAPYQHSRLDDLQRAAIFVAVVAAALALVSIVVTLV